MSLHAWHTESVARTVFERENRDCNQVNRVLKIQIWHLVQKVSLPIATGQAMIYRLPGCGEDQFFRWLSNVLANTLNLFNQVFNRLCGLFVLDQRALRIYIQLGSSRSRCLHPLQLCR